MTEPGCPPLEVVGMPGWLDRIVPDLRLEGGASEHAPEEAPPGGDVVVNR
jgi:hypothetical protein